MQKHSKATRIVKTVLKKTNKIGEIVLPGFMTFYRCYSNQDNMEELKGRHSQWNKRENSELDPQVCDQFILTKVTR